MEDFRRGELEDANEKALAWLCGAGNLLTTVQRRHIVDVTISSYGRCTTCLEMRSTCFLRDPVPFSGLHDGLDEIVELVHWTINKDWPRKKLVSRRF